MIRLPLRAGVIGWPAKHSLSPLIHNTWLKAAGMDGAYDLYEVPPEDFARRVAKLEAEGLSGLNVTVPHKEAAFGLAGALDLSARVSGAANLLLFGTAGVSAQNTDGVGLLAALAEQAPAWRLRGSTVAILGAGGAARGAAAHLGLEGAFRVRIVNRTRARAETLAQRLSDSPFDWIEPPRAYGWDDLPEALSGATLVVNATTCGLNGSNPLRLPWPEPPPGGAALDMVYKPLRSAFLRDAAAAGWATADGLAMLIGQAAPSFTALFGCQPPEEADVRGACLRALGEAL